MSKGRGTREGKKQECDDKVKKELMKKWISEGVHVCHRQVRRAQSVRPI